MGGGKMHCFVALGKMLITLLMKPNQHTHDNDLN